MTFGGILSGKETIRDIRVDKTRLSGRHVSRETRKKRLESDLYIVTRRLKRKPLSITNMGDFQAWKLDIMGAWAAMYLPIADYQSTVNHLIVNRLDSDLKATLMDIIPEDETEFGIWKPEELLQQIEDKLGNLNQEEQG